MRSGWGRRALALAVGGLAVGGVSGSAFAAGTAITGSGSSAQTVAQSQTSPSNGWIASWTALTAPGSSATYAGTASGPGLAEFALTDPATALPSGLLDAYVGTDIPPTSTEIANSATASGTTPVTIPVASTPLAIVMSLPVGVTTSGTQIKLTNALLEEAFRGAVPAAGSFAANSWGALLVGAGMTVSGANASNAITIQARSLAAGTTLTAWNYFASVNASRWGSPWPSPVTTTNCSTPNATDAQEAAAVAGVPGSIGYVALPEAVAARFTNTLAASTAVLSCGTAASHLIAYALVQNNGSSPAPVYADPIFSSQANARGGATGSWSGFPTTITAATSWGGTTASNPSVGSEVVGGRTTVQRYPIQVVTYDVVWNSYAGLGSHYVNTTNTAQTVCDYAKYLVNTTPYTLRGGQSLLAPSSTALAYYTALPSTILSKAQSEAAFC